MNSLIEQAPLLAPIALGILAVWMLLPREGNRAWVIAGLCGISALLWLTKNFLPPVDNAVQTGMFFLFGGGAIISGTLMITEKNPVYAALWFAVVTLSTCGLFLLNAAPFLSAATVVVYAGAIVVTFLFVIMLAQQGGATGYDRKAFQPILASIAGFMLLACLLFTLQAFGGKAVVAADGEEQPVARPQFVLPPANVVSNPLSQPQPRRDKPDQNDLGTLQGVGRSLFGDYLFAVELAGTVLLIATIGTIALAPRRSQGTL
ncbi:MAG TPA: NADH-quinone oxidoreductase subunit J [Planctomycetaceae bacterium]|nr:NADH-quinone oxidoreductase subunit J [Planctomycetaceae bacterium]